VFFVFPKYKCMYPSVLSVYPSTASVEINLYVLYLTPLFHLYVGIPLHVSITHLNYANTNLRASIVRLNISCYYIM